MNHAVRWLACMAVALLSTQLAWAAPAIGFVSVAAGKAWRVADNQELPLTAKSAVYEGDTLFTDTNSHLYIRFKDNGFLSLRPSTRVSIERYHVVPNQPQHTDIRIIVHEGIARSVTGQAGQAAKDRFQLRTPLAVIGIRGTDFTVYSATDATRVSVRSGGIIMAPASLCQSVRVGPCTMGAAELFADQANAMLEVSRDAQATQRIDQVDLLLEPDLEAEGLNEASAAPPDNLGLDAGAISESLETQRADSLISDSTPSVDPSPDPVMVDSAARWGRWRNVANASDTSGLSTLVRGDRLLVLQGDYALITEARNRPQLPSTGSFDFALGNYDASFIDSQTRLPATLSDGKLAIDFAKRRFTVGLTASGSPGTFGFDTAGNISASGIMQNDTSSPFFRFDGVLTGANGEQAESVFSGFIGPNLSLQGGATWGVQGAPPGQAVQ